MWTECKQEDQAGTYRVYEHNKESMNICKPYAASEVATQGQFTLLVLPFFCFKSCVSFVVISSLSCSVSRPTVFNFCLSSGISSCKKYYRIKVLKTYENSNKKRYLLCGKAVVEERLQMWGNFLSFFLPFSKM